MDERLTDGKPEPGDRPADAGSLSAGGEDVEGFVRGPVRMPINPGLLELPLTLLPIRFDPEPEPWRQLDPRPDPWKEAGGTGAGPIGL